MPPIIPLLTLAALAAGWGMRLMDPILPGLARDFGVTVSEMAPVVAGFALAYGGGQLLVGWLGDRLGALRVLVTALFLYGAVTALTVFASSLVGMTAFRTATGLVGGAVMPLVLAYLGATTPYEERQTTISRVLTGVVLAQLLSGPVSGLIAQTTGWQGVFLLAGFGALLTAAVLAWRVRVLALPTGPDPAARAPGFRNFLLLLSRPGPRRLMLATAGDGVFLFGGGFPFVGSYLIEEFHLSPGGAGLVVAGFGLGSLAYTRLAHRLVARLGEQGLLTAGASTLAVAFAAVAVARDWWWVAPAQVTFGLGFFMLHGVLQARATEALPEARATSVAGFAMALFLGQCVGSLIFGAIIGAAGYRWSFIGAGIGILALGAWLRADRG
ncbi:MFS transporter [Roseomonas sp. CCTCC AB2023176]|uniref:MFS transporter n=1 Tax=Roseomonas sp. CCTCC AB2023176 TaxID=3342640 RepID=UPI0035D5F8AC